MQKTAIDWCFEHPFLTFFVCLVFAEVIVKVFEAVFGVFAKKTCEKCEACEVCKTGKDGGSGKEAKNKDDKNLLYS